MPAACGGAVRIRALPRLHAFSIDATGGDMKSRRNMKLHLTHVGLVAALAAAGAATAQTLPREGSYDYISCYSGVEHATIAFSKTFGANIREYTGTNRSVTPGGFLDMSSYRCLSLNANLDGKPSATSLCEAVDRDGDKVFSRFVGDGTRAEATTPAGTGKYEGIVRAGTSVDMGQFPAIKPGTFQRCFRQTGTYKLK
jgi:hypothetical protein